MVKVKKFAVGSVEQQRMGKRHNFTKNKCLRAPSCTSGVMRNSGTSGGWLSLSFVNTGVVGTYEGGAVLSGANYQVSSKLVANDQLPTKGWQILKVQANMGQILKFPNKKRLTVESRIPAPAEA